MEAKFKRNRAYRQNTARLTRQLDRLAHFEISIKYTAGKSFKHTDYLTRNPIEEPSTKENYEEEYVIKILSEIFILHQKYGHLLKTDPKILSTDQSINMALTTNQELTNQVTSTSKINLNGKSKNFTREKKTNNWMN